MSSTDNSKGDGWGGSTNKTPLQELWKEEDKAWGPQGPRYDCHQGNNASHIFTQILPINKDLFSISLKQFNAYRVIFAVYFFIFALLNL